MNCEVLYIASSEEYQFMAAHSIRSLRKVSNLPIVFMTAFPEIAALGEIENVTTIKIKSASRRCLIEGRWTEIRRGKNKPMVRGEPGGGETDSNLFFNSDALETKILNLKEWFSETERDTVIYVDADTRFLADPSEVVSDCYDVAMCREVVFDAEKKARMFGEVVRYSFNTGFLVLNKTERTIDLIEQTLLTYQEFISRLSDLEWQKGRVKDNEQWCNDQRALNICLGRDPLIKVLVLSNEWNVRKQLVGIIKNPKMYHITNLHKKSNFPN